LLELGFYPNAGEVLNGALPLRPTSVSQTRTLF
jgi:hypothetical protein